MLSTSFLVGQYLFSRDQIPLYPLSWLDPQARTAYYTPYRFKKTYDPQMSPIRRRHLTVE